MKEVINSGVLASGSAKSADFEEQIMAWPEYSPILINRCSRCRGDFGGPGKRCSECRQHDLEYGQSLARRASNNRYNHSNKGKDRDHTRNRTFDRMNYMPLRGRMKRYNKLMEEVDANPFARARRPRGFDLFLAATGQRWYGRVL
jgi:hypothetical protein